MEFINHYIVYPFWRTRFGKLLHSWIDWSKILYYTRFLQPKIEKRISEQNKLSIVFFVISISMWKADGLVKRLLSDPRYDIHIVSFLYPLDSMERRKELQNQMEAFFKKKNYPYINSYNFLTNTYFDINELHPDIIFYNQPYNLGYSGYRIERFWKKTLFGYIPYCLNIEQDDVFYDTLYLNICKYVFVTTPYDLTLARTKTKTKGRNCVLAGSLFHDELIEAQESKEQIWHHPNYKHVIWAPHHTIMPDDVLQYSTFLTYADYMLSLAEKYKDTIEFAFKPHPALKDKLYKLEEWGKERTEQYYKKWSTMPNTFLADGSYAQLFAQSDAMIHDCSTFSCEYLYTYKPVLFLLKKTYSPLLTELGSSCLEMHYHAYQKSDIEDFINNVTNNTDSLKEKRIHFVEHTLKASESHSAITTIIQKLNNLFISQ